MSLILLDQDKCTKCGICIKECPTYVLDFGKNGPEAVAPQMCIACGHCVAVCPNEAIDNVKAPLAGQLKKTVTKELSAEEAEFFMRSRRSIRSYKDTSVPREKLLRLVEIARFAPTASNAQGVSYVVVEDKAAIEKATEVAIQWLEKDRLFHRIFNNIIKTYREKGIDSILRGAPCLILTTTEKDFLRGRENSIFSLTYLELYAPVLGLGSCWAGLFEICALAENSPILKLFNIPTDKKITGAVMVGYPQYRYSKLVNRKPLDVTFYNHA